MSISTCPGTEYSRDTRIQKIQDMVDIVTKLMNERVLPDAALWADPDFQRAICMQLQRADAWKRAAEKLAIVKEVFGGTK